MNIPDIIIADDHDLFRDAIKSMLESEIIAHIVAEAHNGKHLLEILPVCQPDMILMDIQMPLMNGIEATREVTRQYPEIKILALSMFGDQQYYYQMIEAGVSGFLLKTCNKNELIDAIQKVYAGQSFFSNDLLKKLIVSIGNKKFAEQGAHIIEFTDRETEIIQHLCQGLSTQEMASKMHLSAKTIENYRVKLLQKTQCKNSISLVVYAIKNNIITI